jgi:hypothetical protein
MIHHVSIPARDPQHVAEVLAEVMGGKSYPFGPLDGAYMAVARDGHSAMIEVYPDDAVLTFEDGEQQAIFDKTPAPARWPFHLLLSVPLDEAAVAAIGAREGWRTKTFGRGVPDRNPFFHVIEFWIENRLMVEVAPPAMAAEYEDFIRNARLEAMDPEALKRTRQSHLRGYAAE